MNEQSIEISRRLEFGRQVRSLRKAMGLNRQELADRTRIPFKTIGNIERGEKVLLNIEWVVKPLADHFGLTGIVREEFFAVAGLLTDDPPLAPDREAEYELITNFYQSTTFPAYVTDAFYTFHSSNTYLNAVYQLDPYKLRGLLFEGAGPNVIRFLLDPRFGFRERYGTLERWRTYVENNLYLLRLNTLRYLGTPAYEKIFDEFAKLPDFTELWEAVCSPNYHPQPMGFPTPIYPGTPHEMQFLVTYVFATRFTGVEQYLIIYLPANDKTAAQLQRIRETTKLAVYQYSSLYPDGFQQVRMPAAV